MISFLLGISVAINIILGIMIFVYLKYKVKKDFMNSDVIVDKETFKDFFSPNYKI